MRFILATLALCSATLGLRADYDIVIYGGTSAGVAAAIQASRMGKSVILIEPTKHLGGMTTNGLGWTDAGQKAVIGGIAREFYQNVKKHYDKVSSWNFGEKRSFAPYRPADDALWAFEPHVAEKILNGMLSREKVEILLGQRLDRRPGRTVKSSGFVRSIELEGGRTVAGRMFIDATYEGDLLAAAGVSYTVGREANAKYGETMNGVAAAWNKKNHRFTAKVSPFNTIGDPASGLLPGIEKELPAEGSEDKRLQAYCFRMCMSRNPDNRMPFIKPKNYDEKQYELLFRNFEAGDLRLPLSIIMVPNGKTDTNNNCAVSTDYIGMNYSYPEASYAEREKIIAKHLEYQQGLMWSLANHPRVPEKIRKEMAQWGLAKDEFAENGHWPYQIYVREARRMVGDYVHTEADCRRTRETPASVGMGSYNMDSHNCTRYVTREGFVQNEGDVQESPKGPYKISYYSIVPKKGECGNLLVPVCLSSSHIAYGSIRMEPVFMILGQSAATAAAIAIDNGITVQSVEYDLLKKHLINDKQVLQNNK